MDAYEFTRVGNDYVSKLSSNDTTFDANYLARTIIHRNPGKDIRNMPQYRKAYDVFTELTMSCDQQEAINWCEYWMANARAYGWVTQNKYWMFLFLASFDLHESLMSM